MYLSISSLEMIFSQKIMAYNIKFIFGVLSSEQNLQEFCHLVQAS